MTKREPIFSVGHKEFTYQPCRGSGPGGQHRNKNYTGMRCTHPPSGATGHATDDKSQKRNKLNSFLRCVKSAKFQKWLSIAIAKASGQRAQIEATVDRAMAPKNLRIETQTDGKWTKEGSV